MAVKLEKGEVQEKLGLEMALQFGSIPKEMKGKMRTEEDRKRMVRTMRMVMALQQEQAKKEEKRESEMEMPLEQVKCLC